MADIARLEEVLGFIESHPELHNQHIWMTRALPPYRASEVRKKYPELTRHECGSQGCLAGWGVVLWGDELRARTTATWQADGAKVFDLTRDEADILFNSHNTLESLRQMVKDMANGLDLTRTWREVVKTGIDRDGDPFRRYHYARVDSDG